MSDIGDRRAHITGVTPPQGHGRERWHRLWVVPAGGEHWVDALGERVVWVWRHYLARQRRFALCLDTIGDACLLCQRHVGRERSGYLAIRIGVEQRTMVVTESGYRHSPSLQQHDGALRGYRIYATRIHAVANGPVRYWLPGDHTDGRRLPAAWDVLRELDVRYGLAHRDDPGSAGEPPAAAQ